MQRQYFWYFKTIMGNCFNMVFCNQTVSTRRRSRDRVNDSIFKIKMLWLHILKHCKNESCFKMYLMNELMGYHSSYSLFVGSGRLVGIIQQVCFSVRDQPPVLHSTCPKIWNSYFIYIERKRTWLPLHPWSHLACALSAYSQPVLLTICDSGLLLWTAV